MSGPIERLATAFEGRNWATDRMSLRQRIRFFRDTGEWPGVESETTTSLFMRENIRVEEGDGKTFCANKKRKRAREAGLEID